MNEVAMNDYARRLLAEHGEMAMLVAAQRAVSAEQNDDADGARMWRRIEAIISQMRGPPQS